MSETGISRRSFLKGAAVTAAAASLPLASATTAVAEADFRFPIAAAQTEPWIPLDPVKAAREALEIYRGMRLGQGG